MYYTCIIILYKRTLFGGNECKYYNSVYNNIIYISINYDLMLSFYPTWPVRRVLVNWTFCE